MTEDGWQPTQRFTISVVPPGVNGLYFNVPKRGRVKTDKYRAWSEAARWELAAQKPVRLVGDVIVEIECYRARKGTDVDGKIKPLLDALTGLVYEDDKQVQQVSIKWAPIDGVVLLVRPA